MPDWPEAVFTLCVWVRLFAVLAELEAWPAVRTSIVSMRGVLERRWCEVRGEQTGGQRGCELRSKVHAGSRMTNSEVVLEKNSYSCLIFITAYVNHVIVEPSSLTELLKLTKVCTKRLAEKKERGCKKRKKKKEILLMF